MPHRATDIVDYADQIESVDMAALNVGDVVVARTRNSTYTITKRGPDGQVTVQGGSRWPQPTDGIFNGGRFASPMLFVDKVGVGMRMEFGGGVVTTSVESISVRKGKD